MARILCPMGNDIPMALLYTSFFNCLRSAFDAPCGNWTPKEPLSRGHIRRSCRAVQIQRTGGTNTKRVTDSVFFEAFQKVWGMRGLNLNASPSFNVNTSW